MLLLSPHFGNMCISCHGSGEGGRGGDHGPTAIGPGRALGPALHPGRQDRPAELMTAVTTATVVTGSMIRSLPSRFSQPAAGSYRGRPEYGRKGPRAGKPGYDPEPEIRHGVTD